MTKAKTLDDIRNLRGPFNALIVKSMRRDGIKEITKWADRWKIGRTTLYNLLSGRETAGGIVVTPSIETLIKLAKAFQMPLHELVYMVEPSAPGAEFGSERTARDESPVRRFDVRVAGYCGAGPDQMEEILDEYVWVEENFARGRELSAFRVRGDSMEGGKRPIHNGDTVLVDHLDKGSDAVAVVAQLKGDGYLCKMLKDDRFGVHLVSANPSYTNGTPPYLRVDGEEVVIVGRVVRVIHDELG